MCSLLILWHELNSHVNDLMALNHGRRMPSIPGPFGCNDDFSRNFSSSPVTVATVILTYFGMWELWESATSNSLRGVERVDKKTPAGLRITFVAFAD